MTSIQMALNPRFWQCNANDHDGCPGAGFLTRTGMAHLCGCECHPERCNSCASPLTDHVAGSPECKQAQGLLADGWELIKEARLARSMEAASSKTGRARAARAATAGHLPGTGPVCQHCGGATKGGLFIAGHDAKLKSELLTAARTGDIEALAEYIWRNWDKGKGVSGCSQIQHDRAKEIASHEQAATWLANRVKARAGRHAE